MPLLAKLINSIFSRKSEGEEVTKIEENIEPNTPVNGRNHRIFPQFLAAINPIDKEEWDSAGCFGKTLCVLKVW